MTSLASDPNANDTSIQIAPGFATASVTLRPRKARPFFGRHPWVLDSAIQSVDGEPADGDIVDLLADNGRFIARGLYNSRSRIRVRLCTWDPTQSIDQTFWRDRLASAIALRRSLPGYDDPEGAARLVFSEADGLSGLVVDRFAQWVSVQANAIGIARRMPELAPLLAELTGCRGIQLRSERGTPQSEGIDLRDGLIWGEAPDGPIFIRENDIRYGIDLAEGQKTGFYLDQRENRLAAARFLGGRRVLDMFCYSGGFALNAAVHGHAREVHAYDSSSRAVALARANAELNGVRNVHVFEADCFDALAQLAQGSERYDAVILDPPKFARSRQTVDEALKAYHRINRLAVDLLAPGGMLVTCSCSGSVGRDDFLYMLVGVAQQTKRELQILEQRGAAPDHPVSAACLETDYLKCTICRVN